MLPEGREPRCAPEPGRDEERPDAKLVVESSSAPTRFLGGERHVYGRVLYLSCYWTLG